MAAATTRVRRIAMSATARRAVVGLRTVAIARHAPLNQFRRRPAADSGTATRASMKRFTWP